VHCGASGAGQAAKICNNMILGATMIVTCEAFALADKLGLDYEMEKVTDINDIKRLCEVADEGITAAITGRAIYEGTLDFSEGRELADQCGGEY
jgi:hypothetical protein